MSIAHHCTTLLCSTAQTVPHSAERVPADRKRLLRAAQSSPAAAHCAFAAVTFMHCFCGTRDQPARHYTAPESRLLIHLISHAASSPAVRHFAADPGSSLRPPGAEGDAALAPAFGPSRAPCMNVTGALSQSVATTLSLSLSDLLTRFRSALFARCARGEQNTGRTEHNMRVQETVVPTAAPKG